MGAMALLRQMYHDADWYQKYGEQMDQTPDGLD